MDKQKKVKLVCLPYAGGSAMMYKAWIDRFADTAEIVQLELPGRGLRFRDPPAESMEALTDDLRDKLKKAVGDDDYILLGFCFGAIVAYALYQKLTAEKSVHSPSGMIIISSLPPGLHSDAEKLFEMSNFTVVKALLGIFSFNPFKASKKEMGIIKTMLEIVNPDVAEELRKMNLFQLILAFMFPWYKKSRDCQNVLRIMRQDGRLMYGYNGEENSVPVAVPVLAVHGAKDNVVTKDAVLKWKDFCSGSFNFEEVSGGHLMLFDDDEHFWDILMGAVNSMKQ